jgi:hypothetical protein
MTQSDNKPPTNWLDFGLKALERTGALVIVAFAMYFMLTSQAKVNERQTTAIDTMTKEISAMRIAYTEASVTQREMIRILDKLSLQIRDEPINPQKVR